MMEQGGGVEGFVNSYRNARFSYHRWRHETGLLYKVALALGFAVFTGLAAQARLYLPFTPVPVTGQVFAVLLAGVVLGKNWGAVSQALYVGLGGLAVPWFAPKEGAAAFSNGGMEVIWGSTGGYLLGFVVAAFAIGWLVDTYPKARTGRFLLPTMLAGVGIIYLFGGAWLAFYVGLGVPRAVALGVAPFIVGDVVKALAVGGVSAALLPEEDYTSG